LTNGTEYYYQVVAENMGGPSPGSDLLKIASAAPVGAPTLLSSVPGNGSVALSWSPVAKASKYSVKRSTVNGGPYTEIGSVNGSSYTDHDAVNGTTYYYVITAINASQVNANNPEQIAQQESMISNQLKAKPFVPVSGAPAQPTDLQAAVEMGSVKLTWGSVSGATQYKVKRAAASGGSYELIASSSAASYEDKSVSNGTTYYYVVSAVNASGESQQSDEIAVLPAKVLTVDASTKADPGAFKTIQSAVNSIPSTNTERTIIYITPGTYTEKLVVTRPYVSLVGAGMDQTKIVYGDYAGTAATTGQPGHTGNTFLSQTVEVNADYFTAANLTIENSAGPRSAVAQAVALSLKSDMATFESVKLVGYQDTLYTGLNAAGKGRHYFHNSIIQGDVDFIFGEAPAAVFDNVKMVLVSHTGGGGHITAAAQKYTTDVGYVFLNSQVVDDASAQGVYDLGRPWKDNASVSFINTLIDSKKFLNAGWLAACAGTCLSYSFSEYNSYGTGADPASRQIAKQLTGSEASKTISNLFDGWDPSIPVIMPKVSYLPSVSVTNSTFDKNAANQADILVMLQTNGNALKAIKNNQTVLGQSDYAVSGSVVTLNKSYLAGLHTGAATLVFEFGDFSVPLTINVVDTSAADIGKQVLAVNDGWASHTTGTKGGAAADSANIFTVTKRSELIKALGGNNGTNAANATPKIIYIKGTIDMNVDDNDNPVGMEYYKDAAYDLNAYLAAYDPAVWGRTSVPSGPLETARAASETNQGNKIKINVGSNTTLVGLPGSNAKVLGGNLMVQNVDNVIIRNIDFQNAFDYFPQWDPTDGESGNWNSAFDNITVKGSTHIWIDHNTFSDGSQPDDRSHTYFGRKYQMHDGNLDITNASDLVTVSYNYFHDHDKTTLVGGSDSFTGDTGKERITFHHNYYQNAGQRAPRVRYGQVHIYNNFYEGSFSHPTYPYLYSIGVGYESQIYAQNNYFVQDAGTPAQALIQVSGGNKFTDKGSILNGAEVNIAASSGGLSDVSWNPTLFTSMDATKDVPEKVTTQAGAENTLPVFVAPSLTATPVLKQVNLSWNAVAGAKAYSVKRSLTSGGPYELVADKLTSSSYVDTGLIRSMTYYYVVTAVNAAGVVVTSKEANATITYEDSHKSSSSSSPAPSTSGGGAAAEPASSESSIRVTPVTEKRADGTSVARAVVDSAAMSKALDSLLAAGSSAADQKVRIAIETKEPAVKVELPASSVTDAQGRAPAAVLSIQLDNITYSLPVKLINVNGLAKELGADAKDVRIIITVEKVAGAAAAGIDSKAKENGLKLLSNGVDFTIAAEANGKTSSINDFGSTYVERTLSVSGALDPNKVTAVLYNPATGKLSFVPAVFKVNGGVTDVTIKRPGNSIYTIVESTKTFADLNGHWAKSDVDLLASKLVVDGTTAASFAPEHPVTRAEFAALLTRALGLNESTNAAYSDVSANDWYAGSVSAASKAGLVNGFEDGTFRPSTNITREQMAVMVSRAIALAGKKVNSDVSKLSVFTDSKAINSWAASAVAQSVNASIINGKSADAFMPYEHASRAEAAVMLKRLLQFVEFMN
jgi:pectate lyase